MNKTFFLLLAIFAATGFAREAYRFAEIIGTENALREIAHIEKTPDDALFDAPRVPFALSSDAPEASEPDDLLESTTFDYAETDSAVVAEENSDILFVDMRKACVPLESGRITSPYGFRHYRIHKGIDIGLKRGDTIRAAFPGKVSRVRYERRGYGRYIVLEHSESGITRTVYAHLSKQLVKVGDSVHAGNAIGLGGNTGRSTGPHLHFEMRIGDMPLDPRKFFDFANHTFAASEIRLPMETARAEYAALQKEAGKHRFHRVRPGDTLGKIARKYHTSVGKLCALNGIKRNSVLRVGKILRCS